jgi:glucose-1-phosphate cytidylyltransferase
MKVVLFCGGMGTRIREYSESIPKPMIPVGHQPILWHIMNYYSEYGNNDFVLCLGYKANTIKDYFLNYNPKMYSDLVLSGANREVEVLNKRNDDWRVALIDTGIWRNIGSRLWAVRHHVQNEEIFAANYSDGMTDVDFDDMVARFKASNKVGSFLAVRPPITYHLADISPDGRVNDFVTSDRAEIWINGGYFLFKPQIFDYMRDGEELVVEPFKRLIAEDKLMAYKHEGFFRSMDTLRDRQILEDMFERGDTPWSLSNRCRKAGG